MRTVYLLYLLIISFLVSSCTSETKKGELIDYIPEGALVVLRINHFENFKSDIKNNGLLSKFSTTNPYSYFSEDALLLHNLHPDSKSLLAINTLNDSVTAYTFISRETEGMFVADSIQDLKVETLAYDDISLQRVTSANQIAFFATKDSVFIASSSQKVLQDILKGNTEKDETLKKAFDLKKEGEVSVLLKSNHVPLSDSTAINFSSWTVLDATIVPDAIRATGVSMASDTISQFIDVFKGQNPQQSGLANIIPTDAKSVVSFTFSDWEKIRSSFEQFNGASETARLDLESISEIGNISLKEGNAIVLRSIDPMLTQEWVNRYLTERTSFRETTIYDFEKPGIFKTIFSPLITSETPVTFQLDNFFVFTTSEEIANQMIIAYKNNDCIHKTSYYNEATVNLSSGYSLQIYKMKGEISKGIASFFNSTTKEEIASVSLPDYPLGILQFTYDRDFAHINIYAGEASSEKQISGTVSEKATIQLEHEILGEPIFFSNHRTNEKDIIVQDVTNSLHLYTASGKKLWTKKLESPILGTVQEIDLLRNGRKQIAFTTSNTFYVLDRNGKEVTPFPIKFKDKVTQPLAVFDYDNNRNYRFVITQGKEIYMYDSKGKSVSGFTFKKATSPIVATPQHIRMGNKDYIIVPEENGTLNILSRVGKSRVSVSEKFEFSNVPITNESNTFVVITKGFSKKSISQNGKVASQKLNVSSNYWFTTSGSLKVTLDDNLLRINGNLIELPFGIYTNPRIFIENSTSYISVTETQENKVFVYNKSGQLLEGFPVYGSTGARVENGTKKSQLLLLTTGSEKEIILYSIN
ncbi:hypothetical protein ACFQO1_02720 [Jejudonia soesokkakensis]|uniref:Uncharacterized protein n=1 Tax=Jejudonia soesokkakensis TaxID=1323432 RepID=A0ABW2MNW2_9FLAO